MSFKAFKMPAVRHLLSIWVDVFNILASDRRPGSARVDRPLGGEGAPAAQPVARGEHNQAIGRSRGGRPPKSTP